MALFKKEEKPVFGVLTLRRLADTSEGSRVHRYHPLTGERLLVRPETLQDPSFSYESMEAEPWPLAGVDIEGEAPKFTSISTSLVSKGREEGWIIITNERIAHRSGGPDFDPWRKTHTFVHCDFITFKFTSGDVAYKVIKQPDKVDDEVTWFYQLEKL